MENSKSKNLINKETKEHISLTFDDIINNRTINSSQDDLANQNIWKEKFFENILYQQLKQNHIEDPDEIKDKYISWHRNLLGSIVNPKTQAFENTSFSNALKVMNIHPYLTKKDKKNLELIKIQIKDSYRNQYIFNCIFGFIVVLVMIRRKFPKVELRELVKKQKFRILGYNMFIFIAYDTFFNSVVKIRLLNQYSQEYKLTKKYISDYV